MVINSDVKNFSSENTYNVNIDDSSAISNTEFLKGTSPSPYSGNSLQLSSQSHLIPNFCKQQQSDLHDSYQFMLSDHFTSNENSRDGHDAENDCDNFDSFEDMQWDVTTSNI